MDGGPPPLELRLLASTPNNVPGLESYEELVLIVVNGFMLIERTKMYDTMTWLSSTNFPVRERWMDGAFSAQPGSHSGATRYMEYIGTSAS